jgi:ABC-type bacteriocin/lantibiotic exporter with double-glycine peptidase domain
LLIENFALIHNLAFATLNFLHFLAIDPFSAINNINESVNLKVGLLVESVEGAETIKSGQGGWRMLSNWMNVSCMTLYKGVSRLHPNFNHWAF